MTVAEKLPATIIVMVMIGMILGVGIITIVNLGDAARDYNTVTGENYTYTFNTSQALTNTECRSFTELRMANATATVIPTTAYSVVLDPCAVTVTSAVYDGANLNATYVAYSDSDATTAMDNVNTQMGSISSTWMGLIVTVMALGIIMALVLNSFGNPR